MGYRSDVAYVINFEDKQKLNEFIAKVMVLGGLVADALKECEIDVVDGAFHCYRVNFYASDVKWYDDFPEVQAHHELMEMAIERDDDNGVIFNRLGEDDNDIEKEEGTSCACGVLYVTRSIGGGLE